MQVRVSDALLPTAMITGVPAAIGLALGCIVAHAYTTGSVIDMLFGSLANFTSAYMSAKLSRGNICLAASYPVIIVTLIVVHTYRCSSVYHGF